MQLLSVLMIALYLALASVSGEEFAAFQFPKQIKPDTPKYFDDYGQPNTHIDQIAPFSQFTQPSTSVLSNLFRAYTSAMRDLGISTWLAQGTLLGWHWGRKVFPWETDVDMHIALPDLEFLALYYNMSVFSFRTPNAPDDAFKQYLLDINPNFPERFVGRLDNNRIDARWVDMANGAYIDITAVHQLDARAPEKGRPILWQTKDGHVYDDADVYPLQRTVFEGVETFVPKNPNKISAKQYTEKSLTETSFHGYEFHEEENQWVATSPHASD